MAPLSLTLDRHSGVPVYRQLVEQVRFQVASGVLRSGDELPSTRSIGSSHGVNPMTVSKAFAELERLGVVERRPGRPHIVAARTAEANRADLEEELRRALAAGASAARRLGVDRARALRVFGALFDAAEGPLGGPLGGPNDWPERED
ncbi:MAG: GntR family transcriptional regulator [Planctomycetota bacterium]